jgi:2-polyprenyl-3-methyl-5-hydroxy-6-metoxy-1,4-benzoquinol methylase
MTTWLHQERLRAVLGAVRDAGARTVLDLGCGDGDMFLRLATEPGISRLVGMDICATALARLRASLSRMQPRVPHIDVRAASMIAPPKDLTGFDCAILIETIEHIAPSHLSQLETALFRTLRPATVIITTPNAEFNSLLGVPRGRFRHPEHQFEWTRPKFRAWALRATQAAGYSVCFYDIAGLHPQLGGASQMAVCSVAPHGTACLLGDQRAGGHEGVG